MFERSKVAARKTMMMSNSKRIGDEPMWATPAASLATTSRDADLTIRVAPVRTESELADVRRLFREYSESSQIDLCFQGFEAELATLPGRYAPPAGDLWLARFDEGAAIGCVAIRPLSEGVAELKRLYVDPASRGCGAGRELLRIAIEFSRSKGYRELRLDTLSDMSRAIDLYVSNGFREISAYNSSPVDGVRWFALDLSS